MKTYASLAVCLFVAASACGRDAGEKLASLRSPNNGAPALASPESSFKVITSEIGTIRIHSERYTRELEVRWHPGPGRHWTGTCPLPVEIPIGVYAIEFETALGSDRNIRSLYVFRQIPDEYRIAHLTSPKVSVNVDGPAPLRAVINAVNASGAAFAIITGDLTQSGLASEFRELSIILDTCTVPTFVSPGARDAQTPFFEAYFGSANHAFTFGRDGYLAFDTKDLIPTDDMRGHAGELQRLRRSIKASRWAVGFSYQYNPRMGMRAQIALFVDNPLDFLLLTHAPEKQPGKVPWGTSGYLTTPEVSEGKFRLLTVGDFEASEGEIIEIPIGE